MTSIIIPCHNRKAVTLACLSHLRELGILERFEVIVVDDGSKDGTSEAISQLHPEVTVLRGDGNLYWTGAIKLGMEHAMIGGSECTVWANDDSIFSSGAIDAVAQRAIQIKGVVSGQGKVEIPSVNHSHFYPPQYRGPWGLIWRTSTSDQEEIEVDACRGNLVAIHRDVVAKIGYPDSKWMPHAAGDVDFTLRAKCAGFPVRQLKSALVIELELNRSDNVSWLLDEKKLRDLWSQIFHRRSAFYPPMILAFYVRHWGVRGILFVCFFFSKLIAISILKVLIPRGLRIKWFSKYSLTWKALAASRTAGKNMP